MKIGDERDNSTTTQQVLQYREYDMLTARFAWPTPWSLEIAVNIVRKVTKTPEVNAPYRAVQYVTVP